MKIKEIIKEDLTNNYEYYLTVGRLKEFLNKHNLPDEAKVVIERVEDFYYENNNWGVYLKENEYTVKDEQGLPIKETMNQYTPAFCCVKYKGDEDVLFIDMHY